MKFQAKAKDLTAAIKTILAVHDFGDAQDDRQPCCITATEDVLTFESAKMGAYVVKRIPGKLLRKGAVGINAKDLVGMKLTGAVTLDGTRDAVKIQDKRTKYLWAVDHAAQQDVEEHRGAVQHIKSSAKIPALVMKSGATFATYKSEVKGDYDVQLSFDKGYFEFCGIDHLSYGRYEFKDARVKVKKPFHFVLGNSLLSKVMKEVRGDHVTIGTAPDGSVVRISSEDLDLYHPTIDKKFMSTTEAIEQSTSGECVCRFTVEGRELKDTLDRVAPVGKKADTAKMEIVVSAKGAVTLRQSDAVNAAHSRLKCKPAEVTDAQVIVVRAQYLKEFVRAAPGSMPLLVESWDGKVLRIQIQEDPGLIDYLAMMVAE